MPPSDPIIPRRHPVKASPVMPPSIPKPSSVPVVKAWPAMPLHALSSSCHANHRRRGVPLLYGQKKRHHRCLCNNIILRLELRTRLPAHFRPHPGVLLPVEIAASANYPSYANLSGKITVIVRWISALGIHSENIPMVIDCT